MQKKEEKRTIFTKKALKNQGKWGVDKKSKKKSKKIKKVEKVGSKQLDLNSVS